MPDSTQRKKLLGPWGVLAIVIVSYYVFYSFFGVTPKYWMKKAGMPGMSFSVHSTIGGMFFAMMIVFALGWHRRMRDISTKPRLFGIFTAETVITLPSGICTAVVIFTTTYMYTLGAVVVAMIIMRGSLLVIGRLVDLLLQILGVREQNVYWQSTVAVLFGLGAVLTIAYMAWGKGGGLLAKPAARITMIAYVGAYAVRQFIMAWYKEKNKGDNYDMIAFFGAEQFWAFMSTLVFCVCVFGAVSLGGWENQPAQNAFAAFRHVDGVAVLSCLPYGAIAFVSVFIFMFEAGSATFNVAINRFTSLLAGFTATYVAYRWLGQRWLKDFEMLALVILVMGFAFLFWAAFRRAMEDRRKQDETAAIA